MKTKGFVYNTHVDFRGEMSEKNQIMHFILHNVMLE